VWPTFTQTTEDVIAGFEAAWFYFGGVFPVVIPEYVPRNIFRVLCPAGLCGGRPVGRWSESVLAARRVT
jgi:hypothetical protein